ncbi:MAG: curli production assembly protein CsgG [Bacteroidetes bacterium]|nr:MAG: curli production assembly protein CsgG [Bacteroidota bacterium]
MIILRSLFPLIVMIIFSSCTTVKPPERRTIPAQPTIQTNAQQGTESQKLKRKVAIARFSNETKYGQGFFYDKNEDRLGKQAMDIFSNKLAATNKFILIERADLEYLNKEKELSKLNEAGIPADYLILGSVNEFGRKATSDVGVFSRTKKQTAYAKVSVRLVEVKTGMIIYSEEGAGEASSEAGTVMGVGETADYDATLNDKVISAAIGKLVSNIAENLTNKPWRSYILTINDGNYIIAGGASQGITEGKEFTVYKRGITVNNPQTGIPIELPGKSVGKLKVVSTVPGTVTTEISICALVQGDILKDALTDYYIEEK